MFAALPPYDKPLAGAKKANLWLAMHVSLVNDDYTIYVLFDGSNGAQYANTSMMLQGGRDKSQWEKFQKKKLAELNKLANMKCPQDKCTPGIDHIFSFLIFTLSADMLKPLIFRELANVALDLFGVMFNPINFGEGTEVYCGFGQNTEALTDRRPAGVERLSQKTFCTFDTKQECISGYKEKLSSGLRLPCEWDDKAESCSESTHEICAIEKQKCGNKLTTFCSLRKSQPKCENSRAYLMRAGRTVPCSWKEDKQSCEPDSESVCSVDEVTCGPEAERMPGVEEHGIEPKGSVPVKKCTDIKYPTMLKKAISMYNKAKTMYNKDSDSGKSEPAPDENTLRAAYCAQFKTLVADGHAHAPCELKVTGEEFRCLASGKEICLPETKCGHHEHLLPTKPDKTGKPCEDFFEKHYKIKDSSEHNNAEAEDCGKRFYEDETGFYHPCIYRKKTGSLVWKSRYGCWTIPSETTPCHYQE